MDELYLKLRERLDQSGIGFPAVPGKDVPYLKKMFTEEQARVYIAMENRFQLAEEIAKRLGQKPEEVQPILDEMLKKAYVMTTAKMSPVFYVPVPWLSGWGDFSGYYVDREASLLEHEYRKEAEFKGPRPGASYKRSVFRTVPVYETIESKQNVATYDNIREIVSKAKKISVSDCYCDRLRIARGEKPYEPLERCFAFDGSAAFTVSRDFGRFVSADEAMEILKKCADSDLVHNVGDLINANFICNCGENCGGTISRKGAQPWRFEQYEKTSNFYTKVNADLCSGCEACIGRCWFDAIHMGSEDVVEIDPAVCEGCGLCISVCPTQALELQSRDKAKHYTPPPRHPNIKTPEEYRMELERYKDIIKKVP